MTNVESNLDPDTVQQVRNAVAKPAPSAAEALRNKIGAAHNIRPDMRDFLSGDDEAVMTRQAERLVELGHAERTTGNVAPREGRTVEPTAAP